MQGKIISYAMIESETKSVQKCSYKCKVKVKQTVWVIRTWSVKWGRVKERGRYEWFSEAPSAPSAAHGSSSPPTSQPSAPQRTQAHPVPTADPCMQLNSRIGISDWQLQYQFTSFSNSLIMPVARCHTSVFDALFTWSGSLHQAVSPVVNVNAGFMVL